MPTTPKPELSPVPLIGLTADQKLEVLWKADCSLGSIAAICGVSRGTISYRIRHGRRKGLDLPWRREPEHAKPRPSRAADRPAVVAPPPRSASTLAAFTDEVPGRREVTGCQWVIGDPRPSRVVYCEAPTEARQSFCPMHWNICKAPKAKEPEPSIDVVPAPLFGSLRWGGPL